MSLYIEQRGDGPDLVLIHGWGLHGGVFAPLLAPLAQHFRLHLLDLPGHGRSPLAGHDYALETLARQIAAALPAGASWLGWSLGGRIAMAAAATGLSISRLILIGSNPCFRQRPDWPHAMSDAQLQGFSRSLQEDYRATLLRFVALQSRGSEQGREELRQLRDGLFAHGEPDPRALAGALSILRDGDLRPQLSSIGQPTLILHGERDTLAPLAAAEYTAERIPHARLQVIEGAGHAPFISHPDETFRAIREFFADQTGATP